MSTNFNIFQLANAPSVSSSKIGTSTKSKNTEDDEIEKMLAQLKA